MAKITKPNLENKTAPNFSLPNQNGENVSLENLIKENKFTLLFFYPKDMTPGCTIESIGFSKLNDKFAGFSTKVLGISKDSPERHCKFIEKSDLKVDLLSDESLKMLEDYGVWIEKSMFGKKYMGISRESVLIDSSGKIIKHWQKVKPVIHPAEVLDFIESL